MAGFGKKKKQDAAEAQDLIDLEEPGEAAGGNEAAPERPEPQGITVRICGQENGLERYENVAYVRVISKRYNILIMKNFMPVLGRLDGSVSFRTDSEEVERRDISGYFMHKNNEFSLLLEEHGEAEAAPVPEAKAAAEPKAETADAAEAEPEAAEPEPEPAEAEAEEIEIVDLEEDDE